MSKLKIAVICGGNSGERDVSLLCGDNIFKSLDRQKYEPFLVVLDQNLVWFDHTRKLTLDLYSTNNGVNQKEANFYDLAFMAMPGTFGEDGQLQSLLEIIGLKYTHSKRLASALAMDKSIASQIAKNSDLKIPETLEFNSNRLTSESLKVLTQKFEFPFILKPNSGGSSVATFKVLNSIELQTNLEFLQTELPNQTILAQQFVSGRELTCPVLGNSKSSKQIQALAVGEIIIQSEFFDYNAKYFDTETQEIFPAQIDQSIYQKIQTQSITIHQVLGCDGLTRSDFILDSKGDLYYLETNTNPGMTPQSLCPKAAMLEYQTIQDFLDKIIKFALE